MYFYKNLKNMRSDRDKSQAEIAQVLGTVREQYNKYETGKQELPMHHFITLAKYYNVSLDYLAGLDENPRKLNNSGKIS